MHFEINGTNFTISTSLLENYTNRTSSDYTDVFTENKSTRKNGKPSAENGINQEAQTAYLETAMKVFDLRSVVYNKISQYTHVKNYNDFPPEAKTIANKMNDFANSMSAGKLVTARGCEDFKAELEKCLNEAKAYQQACLNELKSIYGDNNQATVHLKTYALEESI